jgi:hypothetical protein
LGSAILAAVHGEVDGIDREARNGSGEPDDDRDQPWVRAGYLYFEVAVIYAEFEASQTDAFEFPQSFENESSIAGGMKLA